MTRVGDEAKSLEVVRGRQVRVAEDMGGTSRAWDGNAPEVYAEWTPILEAVLRWLAVVRKDWIAANKRVRSEYPLDQRYGIVPAYAALHRANQRAWAAADVFDVLHYAELGRFKRRIAPFITWEPLPLLRPEGISGGLDIKDRSLAGIKAGRK